MRVFHWQPQSLAETLSFRTEVKKARTAERRVSFADAIQRQAFGFVVDAPTSEDMIGDFLADPNQTFLVPEWPTATLRTSGTITATDTVIPVEDSVVYAVGQQVLIGQGEAWEQAEVDATGTGEITLTAGVADTYAANDFYPTFVVPLVEAICPGGLAITKLVNWRRVDVDFLTTVPVDIAHDPYDQFDDRPFVDDGYLVTGAEEPAGRAGVLMDSGHGAFSIEETETFTRRGLTLSWVLETYADQMRLRRFLHFMRGRDGELYASAQEAELVLNAGFSASALTINVQPVRPAADMVGLTILIQEGSNQIFRTITGATDVNDTEQSLTIATPGFVGTVAAKISFLTKCRFDTDDFEIAYNFRRGGGTIAQVSAPIIEVP